jgi:hypothetical protein
MPVMPHASRGNDDRRQPLTILGGLAEFERTLIRARTAEGRERAKRAWGSLWSTKEALRASASGGAGPDRRRCELSLYVLAPASRGTCLESQ